jgi:hypothetical protein
MNKANIILKLNQERENLLEILDGIPDEAMLTPGVLGPWSIKDILNHLNHWEAELVTQLWQAQQGQKPSAASHSSEKIEELNQQWYREDRERALDMILADFHGVRKQTLRRIEGFSEKDLTQPGRYAWLGRLSLADRIASYSYEHEAEHAEQIQKWRQLQQL